MECSMTFHQNDRHGAAAQPHRAAPGVGDDTSHHRSVLYYPFHLCSEETLTRLLQHFQTVHFRDYMALQLARFFGTTAFRDRMGDTHQDLISAGRLVQGHDTSGALDPDMEAAVDRDLADPVWRTIFHQALTEERRFQRGLFEATHGIMIGNVMVPGPAALLSLMEPSRSTEPYTVELVRGATGSKLTLSEGYRFEYGLALIKTAASGIWTHRIADEHDLGAVTDSPGHYALYRRTCQREGVRIANLLLLHDGSLRHGDF
jgi:hypothetical protein